MKTKQIYVKIQGSIC